MDSSIGKSDTAMLGEIVLVEGVLARRVLGAMEVSR